LDCGLTATENKTTMLDSQSIKMPGLLLFLYEQFPQNCRALAGYFYDKPASLFRSGLQYPLR